MEDEAQAVLRSITLRPPLEPANATGAGRSRLEREGKLGWEAQETGQA